MRIVRIAKVIDMTGLARSTIYMFIKANRFPKPISIGSKAVGWEESEINGWILERMAMRQQ